MRLSPEPQRHGSRTTRRHPVAPSSILRFLASLPLADPPGSAGLLLAFLGNGTLGRPVAPLSVQYTLS